MPITDLTNTTWLFKDTITEFAYQGNAFNINFTSNNYSFTGLEVWDSGGDYGFEYHGGEVTVDYNNVDGWGQWYDDFREITITGGTDVSNETLIEFLELNATQQVLIVDSSFKTESQISDQIIDECEVLVEANPEVPAGVTPTAFSGIKVGHDYYKIPEAGAVSWGDLQGTLSNQADLATALGDKVDKITGKGLSTNDYTDTEKQKLAGIATGAEVNVQSDWNQTIDTADDYIKNKPTLGTAAACNTGTSSGNVPVLDSNGKLVESVIPAVAITDTYEAANEAAMLALTAQKGDICIRSDLNKSFVLSAADASILANWKELKTPTDAVLSVNGNTGAVTVSCSSIGAATDDHTHGNITNDGKLGTASKIVVTDNSKNITTGSIDPADIVLTNDSRLSDARTPASHSHGDVTNDGKITSTAVTEASGIVVVNSNGELKKMTDAASARTLIGAGTSSLSLGNTSSTAAAGDHTHTASIASGGSSATELAANTTYTLTAGGDTVVFKTPVDTGDTHYTDKLTIQANGTDVTEYTQDSAKTLNIKGANAASVSKTATGEITISATDTNQKVTAKSEGSNVNFGDNATVEIKAGSNITVTPNTSDNTITIAGTADTGATSIETTGNGNAVTSASYNSNTRTITLTKGTTFPTADTNQTIKTKDGNNQDVTFGSNAAVELVAGTNVTLTPDSTNNKITIAAAGGGSVPDLDETTFVFKNNMRLGRPLGKYTDASPNNIKTLLTAGQTFKAVWEDIFLDALPITATSPTFKSSSISWTGNTDTFGGKCKPTLTVHVDNNRGSYQYSGAAATSAELTWKTQGSSGKFCKLQVYSDSSRNTILGTYYAGTSDTASDFAFNSFETYDVGATQTLYFTLTAEYNDSQVTPVDNTGATHPEKKITGAVITQNGSVEIKASSKIKFNAPYLTIGNTGNLTEYASATIAATAMSFTPVIHQATFTDADGNPISGITVTGYTNPSSIYGVLNGVSFTGKTSNTPIYVYSTAQTVPTSTVTHNITCNIDYPDLSLVSITSANGEPIAVNSTNIINYPQSAGSTDASSEIKLIGKTTYSDLYTPPTVTLGTVSFTYSPSDSNEYGTLATASASLAYGKGKFKYNSSGTASSSDAGETFSLPTVTYSPSQTTFKGSGQTITASATYTSSNWGTSGVAANCYTPSGRNCPDARTAYITAVSSLSETLTNSATPASGTKYVYYAVTNDTNTPSSWTRYGSGQTGVVDLSINSNAGQYIWIASTENKTSIYEFNEVSGQYNTDPIPTTKTTNQTITNSQNVQAGGYNIYRTTNSRAGSGTSKFKLA